MSLKKVVLFGKQIQDVTSEHPLCYYYYYYYGVCVGASLQWESFEQLCYWQLVCSEGPEVHHIVPLLKLLIPNDHPEAISGIILILRQEPYVLYTIYYTILYYTVLYIVVILLVILLLQ